MKDGRPSQTALRIAQLMLHLGGRPSLRHLIDPAQTDALRRLLTAAGLQPPWMVWAQRSPLMSLLTLATDLTVDGGATIHFPLRKRFIEDEVRGAVRAGAAQLLVIGAGLDTLACRLAAAHAQLLAVEVDHPASSTLKSRGVQRAQLQPPNLTLVPIDLSQAPLDAGLCQTAWRPVQSVVVAEGLLMYLSPDAVAALLKDIHAVTGPGSRLVFTWLPEHQGRIRLSPFIRLGVQLVGEPVRFSISPDRLRPMLQELGWVLQPDVDLRARYLSGSPLASAPISDMERFSVAVRSA